MSTHLCIRDQKSACWRCNSCGAYPQIGDTIVVSGLGRCGTSLLMQMLAVANIPMTGTYPDYEDTRISDPSAGNLFGDLWLGKAVKVLDPHRLCLPYHSSRIIWIDRNEKEQARSISKFGHLAGGMPQYDKWQLKRLEAALCRDRKASLKLLKETGRPLLMLRFETIITDPEFTARKVAEFIGQGDVAMMASVVRKRSPKCYDGLLELRLLKSA